LSDDHAQTIDRETGQPSGKERPHSGQHVLETFSKEERIESFEWTAYIKLRSAAEQMIALRNVTEEVTNNTLPWIVKDIEIAIDNFENLTQETGLGEYNNYVQGLNQIISQIQDFLTEIEQGNLNSVKFGRFLSVSIRYMRSIKYKTDVTVKKEEFRSSFWRSLHPFKR
jgi:soluble cytochrome b562